MVARPAGQEPSAVWATNPKRPGCIGLREKWVVLFFSTLQGHNRKPSPGTGTGWAMGNRGGERECHKESDIRVFQNLFHINIQKLGRKSSYYVWDRFHLLAEQQSPFPVSRELEELDRRFFDNFVFHIS